MHRYQRLLSISTNCCVLPYGTDGFVLDTDDSSLTRSHKYLMHLFEDGLGYEVVKNKLQQNFPAWGGSHSSNYSTPFSAQLSSTWAAIDHCVPPATTQVISL